MATVGHLPRPEILNLIGPIAVLTEIWRYTADVTTIPWTVSIQFDAHPNHPDLGMTANPCWPQTVVNDQGCALPNSDTWYFTNQQRHQAVGNLRESLHKSIRQARMRLVDRAPAEPLALILKHHDPCIRDGSRNHSAVTKLVELVVALPRPFRATFESGYSDNVRTISSLEILRG